MYQLTITVEDVTSTTPFDDLPEAHQALMSHVIAQDLYLHATRPGPPNAPSFTLVRLEEGARAPRAAGSATIAPAPSQPVIGQRYSAEAAMRWTAEHTAAWCHGRHTNPGARYRLAVLAAARDEARGAFPAGTIFGEAVRLSDAGTAEVPRPSQCILERLRRNAISAGRNATINSAGELAAAVGVELSTEITAHQTAALIWYYALIVWAVNAS